jgi:hypothetical protein
MNKNLIMIVSTLCVVLLIVFWVQYAVVKQLQSAATGADGTTAIPTSSSAPTNANAVPGSTGAASSGTQADPVNIGKKTTISAPVHKKP